MTTLKDVFKQVWNIPRETEAFESYWDHWDGRPELLDVIQAYLIKYRPIKNVITNSSIKCNGDFHLGDK